MGNKQPGLLFIISGPTAVGKDSVIAGLRERVNDLEFIITATTREPRTGEVDGQHYFFVSRAAFEDLKARDELLEHATVHDKYYYGVPTAQARQALSEGRDAITRVDVQGAATICARAPQAILIFLQPGSLAELEQRLRQRGDASEEDIAIRLSKIKQEMAEIPKFDYLVTNGNGQLSRAIDDVEAIVRAERCRIQRRGVVL